MTRSVPGEGDLLDVMQRPLDHYLETIRSGRRFRFSRWGDGEWTALLGRRPASKNCDGHPFYSDMGAALASVLSGYRPSPDYVLGLQPLARRLFPDKIRGFLASIGWRSSPWHDADVFHRASASGRIPDVLDAMSGLSVVFVGPAYLEKWARASLPVSRFVEVPEKSCWLAKDRTKIAISDELARPGHAVVAMSCSMMAEVLIDDLDLLFPGRHALIDFGSVWDPYAGRNTRRYHKELSDVCGRREGRPGG